MGCFTHEELKEIYIEAFSKKMKKIHPDIIHSEYVRSSEKVHCKCKICGYEWDTTPDTLLRNDAPRGCPKCAKNVKDTDEEIIERLKNKFNNIIVLSNNIYMTKSILYKFDNSDILYTNTPQSMLKDGFNGFKRYWNDEIYKNELKKINPNIECLDTLSTFNKKIRHYCNLHKKEFLIDPQHALRGQGCDECKTMKIGNAKRKPIEKYLSQLKEVNPNIQLVGKYVAASKLAKHKCLICNNEWYSYPINVLKSGECPKCNASLGEKKISDFLKEYNINNISQYRFEECRNKKPLPFDFAVFDKENNLEFLIEYQGKQHYSPSQFGNISLERAIKNLDECKMRDEIKLNYCNNNNIDLLVIPYTKFDDINDILFKKLCDKKLIA